MGDFHGSLCDSVVVVVVVVVLKHPLEENRNGSSAQRLVYSEVKLVIRLYYVDFSSRQSSPEDHATSRTMP